MAFKINGEIKEGVVLVTRKEPKLSDNGVYTLSTKNALKLSNLVTETLKVKLGDKIASEKIDGTIIIYKTTAEDPAGFPLTKLGLNKSFVRLNHTQLWNELGGNEKNVLKYELDESYPQTDSKGKETGVIGYALKFVEKTPKQQPKSKTAGKGKGNVKRVRRTTADATEHTIVFDLPLNKAN